MACEVPELKITVGPNPTLHQEQLTALLETQIYSHFMGLLYGTQWSLYLQARYTWNTPTGSVKFTTHPQKTLPGQPCFKLTHLQLSPYHPSAPGATFEH